MPFIFLFAVLGLWLGGLQGLIVGGLVGYVLSRIAAAAAGKALRSVQSQFLDATFAVMGALCKADGVVTRDEIHATEGLFAQLRLSAQQTAAAKAAFSRGKAPDFDLDAEVDQLGRVLRASPTLFSLFLQVQLLAVAADGQVHPAEHAMLVRVARRLGLADAEVARLEAMLRAAASGAGSTSGPPPQQRLDDAYAVIGVSPQASDDEVKQAYRKLMRDNHPDRLAAKGLPEGMREMAEERSRQINVAYDLIKHARERG